MKLTYKEFKQLNKTTMIEGFYSYSIIKCCKYVLRLLEKRNLYKPYKNIKLRDHELMKEFRIEPTNGYYRMIDRLLKLKIIECTENNYIPNEVDRKYAINISRLIEYLAVATDLHSIRYPIHHSSVSSVYPVSIRNTLPNPYPIYTHYNVDKVGTKLKKGKFKVKRMYTIYDPDYEELYLWLYRDKDTVLTQEDIVASTLYRDHKKLFDQIDNANVEKMKTLWFSSKEPFTDEAKHILQSHYIHRLSENSYYKACQKEIAEINAARNDYPIIMDMHAKIIGKSRLGLKPSCRQYNDLCGIPSKDRHKLLKKQGYDGEFDLHSAIFAMARLVNTGEFNVEWDIKRAIMDGYDKLSDNYKEH